MSSQHRDTDTRHTTDHVLCPGLVQCSDNLLLSAASCHQEYGGWMQEQSEQWPVSMIM